jgi:hypothetical protein
MQLQQAQGKGEKKQSDTEPADMQAPREMHGLSAFIRLFRKYYGGWFAPEFTRQDHHSIVASSKIGCDLPGVYKKWIV